MQFLTGTHPPKTTNSQFLILFIEPFPNNICLWLSTKLAGNSFGDNDWQFLALQKSFLLPSLFCSNWPQNAACYNDIVAKIFEPRKNHFTGGMKDVLPS